MTRVLRARDWARRRHSTHLVLKALVALVGLGLVLAGVAMLVLPGPGWAAILLGLVVLASEFEPAERLRDRLAALLREGVGRLRRVRRSRAVAGAPAGDAADVPAASVPIR